MEWRINGIVMVQWVNCLRNNIIINPLLLHLLCEISGALYLVQLSLTAGTEVEEAVGLWSGKLNIGRTK